MAITIKDITELPSGIPAGSSPLIYGNGTNLFTFTVNELLDRIDQGITDISYRTIDTGITYVVGGANPLTAINVTIAEGELVDLLIQVIDDVVSLNRYRIPLGEGVYNPLSDTLDFDDLILIERKPLGINPDGSNTVTYVAADLAAINASSPALDLTDSSLIYFIDLDDGFYRFIGTNGNYGSGQLQMVEADLVEISQLVTNPQPAVGTPPVGGTFSVDLSNFFGTDYSATSTSLTSIDIAGGAVLGGFARIKGNWSTKPTITGATEMNSSFFQADTDLYLYLLKWNDGIIYYYDLLNVAKETENLTVITDLTLNTNNQRIVIDASSNPVTLTLPTAVNNTGLVKTLIAYDETNVITIETNGSEEIRRSVNNVATSDILAEGDILELVSKGTYWQVI